MTKEMIRVLVLGSGCVLILVVLVCTAFPKPEPEPPPPPETALACGDPVEDPIDDTDVACGAGDRACVRVRSVLPGIPYRAAHLRYYDVRLEPNEGQRYWFPGFDELGDDVEKPPAGYFACRSTRLFVHFPPVPGGVPDEGAERLRQHLGDPNDPERLMTFPQQLDARLQRELGGTAPFTEPEAFGLDAGGLVARPETTCSLVELVRGVVSDVLRSRLGVSSGSDLPTFHVGRLCDIKGAQLQYGPPLWASEAIGQPEIDPPPRGSRPVIHVFDSGMASDAADDPASRGTIALERPALVPSSDPAWQGDSDPHGTYVARVLRRVVPEDAAEIRSYRILDREGRGTSHDLASALDGAFGHGCWPEVNVVNLSVAWPGSLSQTRNICGVEGAVEDPSGWAVRHALAYLRKKDQDGCRVAAFAAIGNRPGRDAWFTQLERTVHGVQTAGGVFADDFAGTPDTRSWMYPGEWGWIPTCIDPGDGAGCDRTTVIPVGASDGRDRLAGVMTGTLAPALVAPGEHVLVGADGTTAQTGTSYSTAFASGAAAFAQAKRVAAGVSPFDATQLHRALFHSGRALEVETRYGPEHLARRLCLSALASLPQTGLEACAGPGGDAGTEVGFVAPGGCNPSVHCSLPDPPFVRAFPDASCPFEVCDTSGGATGTCNPQTASACPFDDELSSTQFGAVGPTPHQPMCPGCPVTAPAGASQGELRITYVQDSSLAVTEAWVVHSDAGGTHYHRVFSYGQPQPLSPFVDAPFPLDLAALRLDPAFPATTGSVSLSSTMTDGQQSFTDWSPLVLQLQ